MPSPNDCRCQKRVCGCATPESCRCGADCNCQTRCDCGNGCSCTSKK